MFSYEINNNTFALLPLTNTSTKVLEKDNIFVVENNIMNIIKDSCEYYGSSYKGRLKASKSMLDCSYKLPILVEESTFLIFFPIATFFYKI